ncbi:uncharacterized protein LOC119082323 isoform X2 [Bradysia coprophila]|uniref:uncharacterized protein LOC119082323 isoform X2 n=1 Tax=Bradysia coprophila TaxID=38358 RepID=UPI00187DB20D|nr:uncharacterized protein LOC119082323 isoform X2 [Bradysia coprophila]
MEHPGVYCKKCNKTIKGRRYKCIECDDFDLCQSCELDYHSGHILIRFTHPITQTENVFLSHILNQKPISKPFVIQGLHDEEQCNGCKCSPVDGFLYKCCDCTFNACRRCERNNHKCVTGSNHLLFRFADPLSMNRVNHEFWIDILHIRRNKRNQVVPAKPPPIIQVIHEGIKCNACHCDLIGRRYKCIDCREYDLCSSCEPNNIHLGHLLVRVGDTQLRSKQKQIFDETVRLRMSTNQQSYARSAYCDSWNRKVACEICEESIRGYHYECLECEIDLCLSCQLKGWHSNHLMVRFTQHMNRNPVNQKFYEAVKELMACPQPPVFNKTITDPNDCLISEDEATRKFTASSQTPANHKLYDGISEAGKPNGSLKSYAQILHEATMEFTASSPMSAKKILYESTTSLNMSTGSPMSANQALDEAITDPKMSTGTQVFTDQIFSESSASNLCSWYEPITGPKMSTGSPVFTDKIFSESLTDLRTCSEVSLNQALNKAITEPKMSTDSPVFTDQISSNRSLWYEALMAHKMSTGPPVFTDKIFSESLTDLRTCSEVSLNQALNETITEPKMSTGSPVFTDQIFSGSSASRYEPITGPKMSTGSPVFTDKIFSESLTDLRICSEVSLNQALNKAITEPKMSTDSPVFTDQISSNQSFWYEALMAHKMSTGPPVFTDKLFSESLTDLRTCSEVSLNQALNEAITEPKMSTGSPVFTDQISSNQSFWYEALMAHKMSTGPPVSTDKIFSESLTDLRTCSEVSLNQSLNKAITKPQMSTCSPVFTDQISSHQSFWDEALMAHKMSTGPPVFTDKIFSESLTDLRTCSEVSLNQALNKAITEPQMSTGYPVFTDQISSNQSFWDEALMAHKMSTGPPVFTDKIFSESLTDLRTCYKESSKQALNEAITEPKMSTGSPVFTDKIFSESLTDLRTCSKWSSQRSSNQTLGKSITEHSMSTSLTKLANLTLAESTTDLTTDAPVPANHIISEETGSDKTRSPPTSPNQTLNEAETELKVSSCQQMSRTSSRTNLMGKKRGKAKSKKQFTSFVGVINNNDRIAQERTVPKCVLCQEKPCDIILLNCGHLCICTDCIDNYKKMSRQCPVCKFPIRSTHRAYF